MKIIVLGGGLVGRAIAIDLAREKQFEVTVTDNQSSALDKLVKIPGINCIQANLSQISILKDLIKDTDLVIGALPGFLGYQTLKTVIEAGKNIVDISFFPENPLTLNQLALENEVTAIVDCGVAPGCSNLILGHVASILDQTGRFLCYVGGLPVARVWPFEYKIVFSPLDVIEEYTRPARIIENGQIVTKPALSEINQIDFPDIGTLETFNSDGLRTLIGTMHIPFMKEKTLRYPGHAQKMKMLREIGLFNKEPIEVSGQTVIPLEVTAKLLFPKLHLSEGEEDFTIMKIVIEGSKNKQHLQYEYFLLDRYDKTTQTTSMARTTGYTASVMARLVLDGTYRKKGVLPPEIVGQHERTYHKLMQGLQDRNIHYQETIHQL